MIRHVAYAVRLEDIGHEHDLSLIGEYRSAAAVQSIRETVVERELELLA